MTNELGGTHDPIAQYELWLDTQPDKPRWEYESDLGILDLLRDGSVTVSWEDGEPIIALTEKGTRLAKEAAGRLENES